MSRRSPQPKSPKQPSAAARLDRLPHSRWLTTVMVILFLSWLIESYDIGLTGSVLPSLSHLYHLSTGMKSLVAIAGNIGIVIGIVPAGWLADRFGRKVVLVVGTLMYAVLTFSTGLASGIEAVVALRIAAGLAMGAVFPLPYVYGSELAPPNRRGRFTGFADAFLSIGYFASPLLAIALIPSVSNTTGWRVMFFLGGIPVIFALIAWRFLPESPRWYESKGRTAEADAVLKDIEARVEAETGKPLPPPPATIVTEKPSRAPLRAVFSRQYIRRSIMLWITFGGTFFIFYSIQTFMPTVVNKMGFTLTSAFAFTALIVGISIPGKLVEAWVIERWGRKPVIIVFTLAAACAALAFGFVRGALPVILIGSAMSFFGIGVDPAVKVYTTESYPTPMRAGATSATEGFGRLLSGVVGPAFIPPLLAVGGVVAVYGTVGVVAILAIVVVATLGRETKGATLEEASRDHLKASRQAGSDPQPARA